MRFGAAIDNDGIGGEEASPDAVAFWDFFAQNKHDEAQTIARRMASSVPDVTEATSIRSTLMRVLKVSRRSLPHPPSNHPRQRQQLMPGIINLRRELLVCIRRTGIV